MKNKRLVSFVMALLMLFTIMPVMGLTAKGAISQPSAVISIEDTYSMAGKTVSVDIVVANNPGILGATLSVEYDEDLATLVKVTNGEAFKAMTFTTPKELQSGCNLPWDAEDIADEDIKDGVIATLTFEISDNAAIESYVNIGISYVNGAIIDRDMNALSVALVPGSIRILDYTPGDLNDDGIVNTTDVVLLRRYIARGYGVTINEKAADVNDDGVYNTTDAVYMRRYIAGGYGVKLKPTTPTCNHSMTATEAVAATCIEDGNSAYWYCSKCGKYFSDANGVTEISLADTVVEATGHTEVIDEAVAPTYESTGLTEGSHCDVCGTVLIEQQVVEALKPDYYAITYRNDKGAVISDEYRSYASHLGLTLPGKDDISVEGYDFQGWYTEENGKGTHVYEIEAGMTGKVTVYGYWLPVTYKITYTGTPEDFDNNIHEYTIEDGNIYLSQKPEWKHLIFTGWEDTSGKLAYTEQGIPMIEAGTTGDIFLKATWKNRQNIFARADKQYSSAAFNEEDGKYYFFYHLGNVSNVLLSEKEGNGRDHSGVETTLTTSKTVTFSKEVAKGHATSISNATKASFESTLSSEFTTSLSTTIGASATAGAEVDGFFAKANASATTSTEVTAGATWSSEVGISSSIGNETTESKEATSTISFMEESTFTEEESKTLTSEDPRGKYYFLPGGTFEIYSVVVYDPIANELQYDVYSKHIDTYPMILYYPDATDVDINPEIGGILYEVYEEEIIKTVTESFFVFYDAGHEDVVIDEKNARTTDSFKLNDSGNLPENNFYTRYGYVFDGWELRDAKGNLLADKIEDGAAISALAQYANDYECRALELTAKWKIKTVMKITLNDQVADTAADPNFVYALVGKGMFADAEGKTPISKITPPVKAGYTFGGYFVTVENNTFDDATGITCIINSDGTFSDVISNGYSYFADDSTIKALWLRGIYKIELDNQNGEPNTQFYSRYKTGIYLDENCTVSLNENKVEIPKKPGYTFGGYCDSNGVLLVDKLGNVKEFFLGEFTNVTEGMTLYAQWSLTPYTATWNESANITITVKRTSSPNGKASIGTLSSGATVYYGDVLSVTYTADSGYNIAVEGDTSITVTGNVTETQIYASTVVNKYTASWSTPANVTITVKRTSSPNANAATGTLSSGATVYYGDVLRVTYSADSGYDIAVNGDTSITVTGNVTSSQIYAIATGNPYTVIFDLNSSSIKTTPSCSQTSMPVIFGAVYGTLPTPTAPYYTFDGWYTARTGGTKVTSSTTASTAGNHTLYAHWKQTYEGYTYIADVTGLNAIRNAPSGNYMLIDNIPNVGNWTPIPSFSGELIGNGYTLSGITINKTGSSISSNQFYGLFGNLSGKVENLKISASKIYVSACHTGAGRIYAGLLCGIGSGTITNVDVFGSSRIEIHRSRSSYGLISGSFSGKISDCDMSNSSLYGNGDTGGVSGTCSGTVTNCSAKGLNISYYATHNNKSIGGIVGYFSTGGTIKNCSVTETTFDFKGSDDDELDGESLHDWNIFGGHYYCRLAPKMGYVVGHLQYCTASGNSASNNTRTFSGGGVYDSDDKAKITGNAAEGEYYFKQADGKIGKLD